MAWGIPATWGGSSVLIVGVVLLLGQGELANLFWSQTSFQMLTLSLAKRGLCLGGALGISSSGGGLDSSF